MSKTVGKGTGDSGEPSGLLELLAPMYATALRLAGRGADAGEIAAALGIPVESVAGVLDLAAAKLARLEREGTAS
jgi:hypothetical protein